NVLRARCRNRDNNWVETSLESFSRCNGRIENYDGQLRCPEDGGDRGRDWDRDHDRDGDRDRDSDRGYWPRGSYSQTCRDIQADDRSLRAVCQTMGGNRVAPCSSDYDGGVGETVKEEGRLKATRRGGRVAPPGRSSQPCRNIYVR